MRFLVQRSELQSSLQSSHTELFDAVISACYDDENGSLNEDCTLIEQSLKKYCEKHLNV